MKNCFYIDKSIVSEILDHHRENNRAILKYSGALVGYDKINEILNMEEDVLEYHIFLIKSYEACVAYKMHHPPGRYSFYKGFKNRMFAYKKKKDWKNI